MRFTAAILAVTVWTTPAAAQTSSRFYVAATLGSNYVSADEIDSSSLGNVGAGVGVRLSRMFGVEVGVNGAFGKLSRTYEGIGVSFAPPGASREEIERLGVLQRFDREWTPKGGWSAFAVWRDPTPRRVTVAAFAGVASYHYRTRFEITNLRIPAGVDPNSRSLQNPVEEHTRIHGGPTAGVMVPIRVAKGLSVAPEIRYTYGSIGDEIYNVFGTSVRLLWRY